MRVPVPVAADDEDLASLAQAAVDAGALGSAYEPGTLMVYVDRAADPTAVQPVIDAIADEARRLGWPVESMCVQAVPDAPWAIAWREGFESLAVGRRLLIRPEWERGQPAPDPDGPTRRTIWVRPGLGFGTGRHASTRLALELLERYVRPGDAVLDFGAGNAILAIAAVRLGAASAWAIESDPQALANAQDNLAINELGDRVTLIGADRPIGVGPADLIVCNMLPHEATPHFADLVRSLRATGSRLIYSGVPADQLDEIETALRRVGLNVLEGARSEEWAAVVGRLETEGRGKG